MQPVLAEYKRDTVNIAAFGGLNHTDFTKAGEWYAMENLSDTYAPLLAPRRSRALYTTLPAPADTALEKNGIWYFTKTGSGIYCYAPNGDNPFAAAATTEPLLIFESEKAFTLLEMGNSLLAVPQDGSAMAVAVSGAKVEQLGYNEAYHYESMVYTDNEQASIAKMDAYAAKQRIRDPATNEAVEHLAYYSGMRTDRDAPFDAFVPNTQAAGGYYDAAAQSLLNIGFTYAVRREDGSYYFYNHERDRKFSPAQTFATSQYFLGTDNCLYDFDSDSGAVTQVTTPYIALMFHLGLQCSLDTESRTQAAAQKTFPQLEEGDYIRLSVGPILNTLYRGREIPVGNLIEQQLLRVHRCFAINAENSWGQRGWTHCVVVDYSAAFADTLRKKDLIHNSVAYTKVSTTQIGSDFAADRGLQQLYPQWIDIEAPMPALVAPLEHNNRVWGASNVHNEIKASAQGNFKNWEDYRGLISDSYAVGVGSNGAFTASCVIGEYLFFFKEHSYTCVYGTRPANYSTNTCKECIGIRARDACSLQVIGTNAYYMGVDGRIYRFNARSAVCISEALGKQRFTPLAAAHTQEKYFLLVEDDSGEKKLLVYRVRSGTWWVEDAAGCDTLCNINAQACALAGVSARRGSETVAMTDVLLLEHRDVPEHENNRVAWWCESGLLGLENEHYRYISRLKLTFESEVGASLEVLAKFDDDSDYTLLASFVSARKGTRCEQIDVRRCAFLRLKIRGRGKSKIFRIGYVSTQGGEK